MRFTLSEDKGYQEIVNSPRWRVSDGFVRRSRAERACFLMPSAIEHHDVEALFVEDKDGARIYIVRDGIVIPGSVKASLAALEEACAGSRSFVLSRIKIGMELAATIAIYCMRKIVASSSYEVDRKQAVELVSALKGRGIDELSRAIFAFLTDGSRVVRAAERTRKRDVCPPWSPQRAVVIRVVAEALANWDNHLSIPEEAK